MLGFNWDHFKSSLVAVNCPTKEKAQRFLSECHVRGIDWGKKKATEVDYWEMQKEETCYIYDGDSVRCGSRDWYIDHAYEVIEWDPEPYKVDWSKVTTKEISEELLRRYS